MSNTLRPYYDRDTFDAGYSVFFKPGVGLIDTDTNKPITASLASSLAKQTAKRSFKAVNGIGISGFNGANASNASDKNYVYDLELNEYFDFNNVTELLKNLVWSFVKNYCKVLLSQPLEIVRLVLQVGYFPELDNVKQSKKRGKVYSRLLDESTVIDTDGEPVEYELDEEEIGEDDDEDEVINYFETPGESLIRPTSTTSASKRVSTVKQLRSIKKNRRKIHPISKHTVDIMSSLVAKDGPFALFRGINAAFIHQTLSHTIEAWITGFISPFLGIPDPFFLELTRLTDPWKSLWLSVLACVLTGLILMPLDLIKIRLMITQFNKGPSTSSITSSTATSDDEDTSISPTTDSSNYLGINTRSIRDSIRNYPLSVLLRPPPTITMLTILYQFSTTIFRKTAPYILYIKFNVDSYLSPKLYTMVNLLLLIMEFFVKLPLENLLRKEQVRFLVKDKGVFEDEQKVVTIEDPDKDLIVEFNDGWKDDEDPDSVSLIERVKRLGLFNGWRVGVLNVVGFWGYNMIKNNGIDLTEERL